MKKLYLMILLLLGFSLQAQVIPCEFTLENTPTNNGNKNFVTPAREQPYQGPCLAFAFNGAAETVYAMEHNWNNPSLALSDAYMDYKVWGVNNYKTVLESGFKIPLELAGYNGFPEHCDTEFDCHYLTDARACLLNAAGQQAYQITSTRHEQDNAFYYTWELNCAGPIGEYVTVGQVYELTQTTSELALKQAILDKGPVVVRINSKPDLQQFKAYAFGSEPFKYHALTIIGWKETSQGTQWRFKDSWPNAQGIYWSNALADIGTLLPNFQLYQVSDVLLNGASNTQNPVSINTAVCPVVLNLSNLHLLLDYSYIGGKMYHKFWVTSDFDADSWTWGIDYPNGAYKRSQVNQSRYSSVLLSPSYSGMVTVFVNAFKNGQKITAEKQIYLTTGSGGGMH